MASLLDRTAEVESGSNRVIRGGSWNSNARNVRAANRNANDPGNRNDNLGFRLARARGVPCRAALDQTSAVTGARQIGAGEIQADAGVTVAVADALASSRRWLTCLLLLAHVCAEIRSYSW